MQRCRDAALRDGRARRVNVKRHNGKIKRRLRWNGKPSRKYLHVMAQLRTVERTRIKTIQAEEHRITTEIVREQALIAIEDTAIRNMTKSAKGTLDKPGKKVAQKRGLNRSILSQRWAAIGQKLEYKSRWYGRPSIRVPAPYTKQERIPMAIYTQAPSVLRYLNQQTISTTPEERLDRARGVVFGLAVGNVYGIPLEFQTHEQIAQRYPVGLPGPDPAERNRPMDDDLAQAVDLGEALQDPHPLREFRRRLIEWKHTNGRGIGNTTREVIEMLSDDPDPSFNAAKKVYKERNGIAPNGGVMRCAPVGVKCWEDPESLIHLSARTCALTHYAPLCQWSCIMVNAIIASELRGNSLFLHRLLRHCVDDGGTELYARDDRIPTEILERVRNAGRMPDRLDSLYGDQGLIGHTLIALQVGLWAADTALDFEEALEEVMTAGGDTDTNGAVAGAVLGVRYGYEHIPAEWLDCVPEPDRLERLARDLLGMQ